MRFIRVGTTVQSSSQITSFLKGFFHELAVTRKLLPTWDFPLVLNHLAKSPFEPLGQATLRNKGLKAAFLLQLASGRRVSWTHGIRITPGYLRHQGDGYMILPEITLDKNQTAAYTPSPVFISSLAAVSPDDKVHCPIRAMKYYMHATENVRDRTVTNLFLISQRPFNSAKKTTISGWIKEVISGAYKGVSEEDANIAGIRAHDTRVVSACWAKLAGVPVEEILEASAWKTPHTFCRHYLKDLSGTRGKFGRSVILTAAAKSTV